MKFIKGAWESESWALISEACNGKEQNKDMMKAIFLEHEFGKWVGLGRNYIVS